MWKATIVTDTGSCHVSAPDLASLFDELLGTMLDFQVDKATIDVDKIDDPVSSN